MAADSTARRILFIGNSLTYYHGGLDGVFRAWGYDAAAETSPGATLEDLWKLGGAKRQIMCGDWDVVVLQEDLPEYPPPEKTDTELWKYLSTGPFLSAATNFVKLARDHCATPLLFMAHPYGRLAHATLNDIRCAHKSVGNALGVGVAPCGLAHAIVRDGSDILQQMPFCSSVHLLEPDDEHPSEEGVYLNACCIATAMGHQALEPTTDMPEDVAEMLRKAAMVALEQF